MSEVGGTEGEVVPMPQIDSAGSAAKDVEPLTAEQRLIGAVKDRLAGSDGIIVDKERNNASDPTKVIVVDSADGQTHVTLEAHKGFPNYVRGIWRDESNRTGGHVWWTDTHNEKAKFTSWSTESKPADWDKIMDSYNDQGGYNQSMGGNNGQPMTEEELVALAEKLEGGHTNPDLTNAALVHLTTTYGAVKISEDKFTPSSSPRTKTEAIE